MIFHRSRQISDKIVLILYLLALLTHVYIYYRKGGYREDKSVADQL